MTQLTPELLYLDLLKKCLTRSIFGDSLTPYISSMHGGPIKRAVKAAVLKKLRTAGIELYFKIPFDREMREMGRDWPVEAETMIGLRRLDNLQTCIETILADKVPGDLVETGVWRGGASIFMKAALDVFGVTDRTVWCADSFAGLPTPNVDDYPQDKNVTWHTNKRLAVSLEDVQINFERYGVYDDRVKFLKGWFKDTLPTAPIVEISLLRLDGDMYESTMDALNNLYAKVAPGGFIIVDDFGIPEDTCRRAVHDFRFRKNIHEDIVDIDGWGAFWRRSGGARI
jgi:O-methyltransferase